MARRSLLGRYVYGVVVVTGTGIGVGVALGVHWLFATIVLAIAVASFSIGAWLALRTTGWRRS